MKSELWIGLLLAGAIGCNGSGTPDVDPPTDDSIDDDTDDAVPTLDAGSYDGAQPDADAGPRVWTGAILNSSIGPIGANPGAEDTVCVTKRLGNDAGDLLGGIRVQINPGSHHLIVYASDSTTERPTPTPCTPFAEILGGESRPLLIAQQSESELFYPDGTALPLAANQMVRIELHYFNYFDVFKDDIAGNIEFLIVPDDGMVREEVGLIFWGTTAINLPPHDEGEASFFSAIPLPTSSHPEPIRVFALTSHTHQRGELAFIERATSANGEAIETLHTSTSWEDPPLDTFEPALTFEEGEGLRLTCRYYNDTDDRIYFGEEFNDEMCFLWAYYYPSRGFIGGI